MPRLLTASLFFALLCMSSTHMAHAGSEAVTEDTAARLAFIQDQLDGRAARANGWFWGWLAGFSATAIAQGAVALAVDNPGLRADQAVGAATAVLGAVGVVMSPVPTGRGARHLRTMAQATGAEAAVKLQHAEAMLRESAAGEMVQRNWVQHTLNAVVGLGSGVVLWAGWQRPVPGLIQTTSSIGVGELMILTTPVRGRRAWQAYLERFEAGDVAPAATSANWGIWVRPEGVVGLTARF